MAETLVVGGDGVEGTRKQLGDFTDRQVRHREIYQMHPISAANSSRGGRNRGRRSNGDSVVGARARGGRQE
jgi:hypothetical protein